MRSFDGIMAMQNSSADQCKGKWCIVEIERLWWGFNQTQGKLRWKLMTVAFHEFKKLWRCLGITYLQTNTIHTITTTNKQ